MKKFLSILLVFIFVVSITGCGSTKKASGKVKVYLFEAGGCPYCEAEIQYLEGLSENGTKFEIVRKELYVDHIEWQPGKDYNLGVKVATKFNEAGFTNATYQATPFVVISDIYAEASYNTNLIDTINKAYEEGDNDVVGCLEKSDDCEIRKFLTDQDKKISDVETTYNTHLIVIYSLLGIVILYLIISKVKGNKSNGKNVKEVKVRDYQEHSSSRHEEETKKENKKIEKNDKKKKK